MKTYKVNAKLSLNKDKALKLAIYLDEYDLGEIIAEYGQESKFIFKSIKFYKK